MAGAPGVAARLLWGTHAVGRPAATCRTSLLCRCEESFRLNPATGKCQGCSNELCAECGADLKTCRRCVETPYWAESDLDFGPIYKDSQGECTEVSFPRFARDCPI